jgi:hypothetical protein
MSRLRIVSVTLAGAVAFGLAATAISHAEPKSSPLAYTADGKMVYPADYRTWVYLSTGVDMSYSDAPTGANDPHVFDSVFVNREAYDAYQKTGTWPDKTVMVLEVRRGASKGSINKKGQFQAEKFGAEVHVKDVKRFSSGWGFFPFGNGDKPAPALAQTSQCNVCHEKHGAVDTTFVQFYPTLIAKAQEMKTMSAAYLAEEKASAEAK